MKALISAAAVLVAVLVVSTHDEMSAHVTVVSPFTYHRDIAPILERRCASCHTPDGAAPAALTNYQEVREQAVAMRRSLMSGRMPPWSGQSGVTALKEQSSLTARELDMLMTWSAGGTPEGVTVERARVTPVAAPGPDTTLTMPEPFVLRADRLEADHEVEWPSASLAGRWIRAATLVPERAAIVRRAEISIRSRTGDQVVALWLPGEGPQDLSANGGFEVPADGRLRLRIHYQQPRPNEPRDFSDSSAVGIFLASAPAAPIRALALGAGRFVVPHAMKGVAFRVVTATPDAEVTVDLTLPGGRRSMLVRFKHRPEWPRRYVFVAPVLLPQGATVDVRVTTSSMSTELPFAAALEIVE